ncbi:MAG: SRPBCC family protein [Pseudomonadota bacterium]
MTDDYGDLGDDGILRFVRMLPGPIDRVWAYLTEPEKRAQWFCGGETAREPGGKVVFDFDHSKLTPHDDPFPEKHKELENGVRFEGTVEAYEPPHRLTLLWPSSVGGDDSRVTFRLVEVGDQVRLELEQSRIPNAEDLYGASAGWHGHFAILIARLKGETPPPFWSTHEALDRDYRDRFTAAVERVYGG